MFKSGVTVEGITLLISFIATMYYFWIARKGGKLPEIKDIPALRGIDEGVGRAVELNKPVHQQQTMALSGLATARMLASLQVGAYIARICARKGANLICHMGTAGEQKALIIETMREAYIQEGKEDALPDDFVRFHAYQAEVAAGSQVNSMIQEGIGMYYSTFYNRPVALTLEAAKRLGAIVVGGSSDWIGMWMYAVTADYLLITEDIFAAGALLSGNPDIKSRLAAEDSLKLLVVALLVLGFISMLLGINFLTLFKT